MTINVRRLGPRNLQAIDAFQYTPCADPWVADVERFLLGAAARDAIRRSRQIWVIEHNGTPVGLAANRDHELFNAELLQALMIDHRYRGMGLAPPVLEGVLKAVHQASDAEFVMWLVHPDNTVMLHLSLVIDPAGGDRQSDGYRLFAHQR